MWERIAGIWRKSPPKASQMLVQYHDSRYFPLPEYVQRMPARDRLAWMHENAVVPAGVASQPDAAEIFLDRARKILDATRLRYPGAAGAMAAYSMYEMYQPFMVANGVAVTASGNAALSPDTLFTLPAMVFAFPGKTLWLHAAGIQSNVVTTPGTYTFGVYWGGTGGTLLRASGAIPPSTVVLTSGLWFLDFWVKARATGALTTSLTLHCYGKVNMSSASLAAAGTGVAADGLEYMPAYGVSMAADIANLDQTIAKALTLAVNPSVATGSISMTDGWIVALN